MSTSDKFRTHAEMTTQNDFIQTLERLVSGDPSVDSSAASLETGVNRPLARLARNTDALLDVVQTNKNCFLTAANANVVMSYTSAGQFSITGTTGVYIHLRSEVGGAAFNTIAPSGSPLVTGLAAGHVIYVQLNRTTNATVTVSSAASWSAFISATSNANRLDYLILGLVTTNNDLLLFNGLTIRADQQLENALATDSQYGSRFVQQQNRNAFLANGGTITFDATADTFTFSADLRINLPGNGSFARTTISATTLTSFVNGSAITVNLSRTSAATVTANVQLMTAVTVDKDTEDLFIIAYRSGNHAILSNGATLQSGDSYKIEESPVHSISAEDSISAGTTTSVGGTVEFKDSAGMVTTAASASSGASTVRFKNRRDNLQVSIGTALSNQIDPSVATTRNLIFAAGGIASGMKVRHPDFSGFANRIRPSTTLQFTATLQVAYVIVQVPTSTHLDYTTVVNNDHVSAGDTTPASQLGNIYVCDISAVNEDDADVFIFARRIDGDIILWDRTVLLEHASGEQVIPGRALDRAIMSSNYDYFHGAIAFEWCRSGQADHEGNTSGGDRIAISWDFDIDIHWPAGGETKISANAAASPIILNSSATIAYLTIPLADRANNVTYAASDIQTTSSFSDINSVEDFILFNIYASYDRNSGSAFTPASLQNARRNPVNVFGNRNVHQQFDADSLANSAVTGSAQLGRTTVLRTIGDNDREKAWFHATYPSDTNPFVTTKDINDFQIGEYTGTSPYEGGTPTFTEKFSVTASSGAIVSKSTVQGTGFNYGDSSGAVLARTAVIFMDVKDLLARGFTGNADRYTTDHASSSSSITQDLLYHTSGGDQQTGTLALGTVDSLIIPPTGSAGFAVSLPEGSTLSTIIVHLGSGSGFADRTEVRLRCSLMTRFSSAGGGSFTVTSESTLVTDGSSAATLHGMSMVSPSGNLDYRFEKALFNFSNTTVSSGSTSKAIADATDQLWIRIGNADSSDDLHIVGVVVKYTATSVDALLGLE